MIINFGTCEDKIDLYGRPIKKYGFRFKRFNYLIVKGWKNYELFQYPLKNKSMIRGQFLNSLEIKWIWQK